MTAATVGAPVVLLFTVDEIDERGLNARDSHWSARASAEASIQQVVKQRVKRLHARQVIDRAHVEVVRLQRTAHRRDPDNLAATAKPMIDGLVQAGLLPDDSHRHVASVVLRVVVDRHRNAGWRLTVTPTAEEAP